jgi:hypothetical protein
LQAIHDNLDILYFSIQLLLVVLIRDCISYASNDQISFRPCAFYSNTKMSKEQLFPHPSLYPSLYHLSSPVFSVLFQFHVLHLYITNQISSFLFQVHVIFSIPFKYNTKQLSHGKLHLCSKAPRPGKRFCAPFYWMVNTDIDCWL